MAQQTKIGSHKTVVFTENGWTKVVYHQTCVIKWNANTIVLDSGGWYGNTTKTRINQACNQYDLGIRVYQKNYNWFVSTRTGDIDFKNGMEINREDIEYAKESKSQEGSTDGYLTSRRY